jgi:arginyl-tRNA synthetase
LSIDNDFKDYFPNPIKTIISSAVSSVSGIPQSDIYQNLQEPPDSAIGDYGWPCFSLAKIKRKAPPVIAAETAGIIKPHSIIEKVSSVGPYLNFTLNQKATIQTVCENIFAQNEKYGSANIGSGKTIVIDYSSPNIAKPMGIGHLRSTVIGAALKRIYQYLGYKVVGINHLGDWGTQFGKLVAAYRRWADQKAMDDDPIKELYRLYVKIHEEAENDQSLEDESREIFKRLEEGDPEITALWRKFIAISKLEFNRLYNLLGITFESEAGESFYNDKLEHTVKFLEDKGLTKISREALIVPLDEFKLEPLLLKKRDGSSLYGTRDLAAAIYRYETYKFDLILYVVGVAQTLHFKQLFKTLELAGFEWAKDCRHVSFGWVTLGGEMMATRRGNIVFLEDVIEQTIARARAIISQGNPDLENPDEVARKVGVGAVVFSDLAVRRDTDVSFEWERMLDFDGQTGPYLQYAHARICSLIRKYGKEPDGRADYSMLKFPEEFSLAKKLLEYPDKIKSAAELNEPYIISAYLLDLAGLFSTYFQKYKSPADKIISDNSELTKARINLAWCVRVVLKSGLNILGIDALEKM